MVYYSPDIEFIWQEGYRVLPQDYLKIPGLHMIGYSSRNEVPALLQPHYHHGMEFVVVLKGRQQYFASEHVYPLHGGDIFMSFPDEIHGNEQLSRELCEFIWFQLDFTSPDFFLGLTPPFSEHLYERLSTYRNRITHVSQKDLGLLRNSFEKLCSADMNERTLGYSCFLEFLLKNFCCNHNDLMETDPQSALSNALHYIHSHLTENPTTEQIAGSCSLSASQLHKIFLEQTGATPHAYIMNLKIDTAKILLKDPLNTITDVAYQLNFSSGNHFASVFKKYTGDTPTEYRRQHCSNIF